MGIGWELVNGNWFGNWLMVNGILNFKSGKF